MTPHSGDYEVIRSYLLGTLPEEDRQFIEERLLSETAFLEELLVGEEELIDDYVSDDLPADSRLRFEQHFLCTPDRKQKLRFAFALGRYTSRHSVDPVPKRFDWMERFKAFWGGQTPAFRFAMSVAVMAFVIAAVLISIPPSPPPTFATVTVTISSAERAEGAPANKVKLAQDVDSLKILMTLPASSVPARGYRVEWVGYQGVKKPLAIETQGAQSLTLVIPARELARGQNALHLYVTNPDGREQRINGSYYFTVE